LVKQSPSALIAQVGSGDLADQMPSRTMHYKVVDHGEDDEPIVPESATEELQRERLARHGTFACVLLHL
jgi:hypothetical protein